MIDELLASDRFIDYWTLQFAKLLRIRPLPQDQLGMNAYHSWLREQIQSGASYREMVRTLILATGNSHVYGPANFYRGFSGPREQAEFVSETLMATRLRCANCHNHPLDRWTQDDYHGLAAIFAKVDAKQQVRLKPTGQTIHPATREPASPKIPGGHYMDKTPDDPRRDFADWLTDTENEFFAKALVNRLWKSLMGRGLVEPADDFRTTNPATHPELLNQLAHDFVSNGYRLRPMLRQIANSRAYQRGKATAINAVDDAFYSHSLPRRLAPEVMADAISDVLGVHEQYGDAPLGTRAISIVNPQQPSESLDILGRCGREESCEAQPPPASGLAQTLHRFNGKLLNARLRATGSRLQHCFQAEVSGDRILDEFYLASLCRLPTQIERQYWLDMLRSTDNPEEFWEDFVWGLLSSQAFMNNQ